MNLHFLVKAVELVSICSDPCRKVFCRPDPAEEAVVAPACPTGNLLAAAPHPSLPLVSLSAQPWGQRSTALRSSAVVRGHDPGETDSFLGTNL